MNYAKHVGKLNNRNIPMVDTHYYHWLEGHAFRYIGPSTALLGYLEYMFGFIPNTDRIDRSTIDGCGYIHQQYWSNNREDL